MEVWKQSHETASHKRGNKLKLGKNSENISLTERGPRKNQTLQWTLLHFLSYTTVCFHRKKSIQNLVHSCETENSISRLFYICHLFQPFFSVLRLRQHPARFLRQQLLLRHCMKTCSPKKEELRSEKLTRNWCLVITASADAVTVKTGSKHEAADSQHLGELVVELVRFVRWLPILCFSQLLPSFSPATSATAGQPACLNGVLLPCCWCSAMQTPPEHFNHCAAFNKAF